MSKNINSPRQLDASAASVLLEHLRIAVHQKNRLKAQMHYDNFVLAAVKESGNLNVYCDTHTEADAILAEYRAFIDARPLAMSLGGPSAHTPSFRLRSQRILRTS